MKENMQKKVSYYLVLGLVSLIILGFLFTGYQGGVGPTTSNSHIGEVAGIPVTAREFQAVYDQQVQFFSQFTGGKPLTKQQLEQFGLEKRVEEILIGQKLMVKMAKDLGLKVSKEELAEYIKSLPYFKVEDKFNINAYKGILKSNRISIAEFEGDTANTILSQDIRNAVYNTPLPKNYTDLVFDLKNTGLEVNVVKFRKKNLQDKITVSTQEAESFANNPENQKTLQTLYNRNLDNYKTENEVQAKHILIQINEKRTEDEAKKLANEVHSKVTTDNFSELAKKYSDDSSGKDAGGDLGWFSKGKMVKPFEEKAFTMKKGEISSPIKTRFGYHIIYLTDKKEAKQTPLEEVKVELAKKHLQENNPDKLNELANKLKLDIKNALSNKQFNKVEKLKKDYGLSFEKNVKINSYDLALTETSFSYSDFQKISAEKISEFSKSGEEVLVQKVSEFTPSSLKDKTKKMQEEIASIKSAVGREYGEKILENLKKSTSANFNYNI